MWKESIAVNETVGMADKALEGLPRGKKDTYKVQKPELEAGEASMHRCCIEEELVKRHLDKLIKGQMGHHGER